MSTLSKLLWRLLLLPAAFLLAPLIWIGGGLLALGVGGEPAAQVMAAQIPAAPALYRALMAAGDAETQELLRVAISLAGVMLLSLGYFPIYDLWRRGCEPPEAQEPVEEEVFIIP